MTLQVVERLQIPQYEITTAVVIQLRHILFHLVLDFSCLIMEVVVIMSMKRLLWD